MFASDLRPGGLCRRRTTKSPCPRQGPLSSRPGGALFVKSHVVNEYHEVITVEICLCKSQRPFTCVAIWGTSDLFRDHIRGVCMVARPCGAALAKGRVAVEARLHLGWNPSTARSLWGSRWIYLLGIAIVIFLCWAGVPVIVGFLVGEDGDHGEPSSGGATTSATSHPAADGECRAEEQGDDI